MCDKMFKMKKIG